MKFEITLACILSRIEGWILTENCADDLNNDIEQYMQLNIIKPGKDSDFRVINMLACYIICCTLAENNIRNEIYTAFIYILKINPPYGNFQYHPIYILGFTLYWNCFDLPESFSWKFLYLKTFSMKLFYFYFEKSNYFSGNLECLLQCAIKLILRLISSIWGDLETVGYCTGDTCIKFSIQGLAL